MLTALGLLWVDGLTLRNFTLANSPFWSIHPTFCNNVDAYGFTVQAPSDSRNTDGMIELLVADVCVSVCVCVCSSVHWLPASVGQTLLGLRARHV